MKKLKNSNLFLGLCAFMITAAPLLDMSTRCAGWWGEPDYPQENDHI